MPNNHKLERRARNRAFIDALNAKTFCAHCGAQPIEWHNPEHVELNRQTYRIGFMVSSGASIEKIQTELARCTPLCRSCHMKEDGRLSAFKRNRGNRPRNTNPCSDCQQQYFPLRRGLCHACTEYQRRHGGRLRREYLASLNKADLGQSA